ncbi:MAG: hypothetical protein M1827_006759 [Pycnora praestabilis]|nr:MAG: hypothetical protein M1827_006759 [Pycnora praestabilis]
MAIFNISAPHPKSKPLTVNSDKERDKYRLLFGLMALLSLSLILGPFLIFYMWHALRNWGSWRVTGAGKVNSEGALPFYKKQYIRTWHGWVEKKEGGSRKIKRKRRDLINSKLPQRTARTDYSWVFWDPSGLKRAAADKNREIKWLPSSLRGDFHRTSQALDLEKPSQKGKGLVSSLRHGHSSSIRLAQIDGQGDRNSSWLMSGAVPEDGTVTICGGQTSRFNSSYEMTEQSQPQMNRTNSMHGVEYSSSIRDAVIDKIDEPLAPVWVSKKRDPDRLSAPQNSEEVLTLRFTPIPGKLGLYFGGKPIRAVPSHIDGSSSAAYEPQFANSLGRRLEIWAAPMIIDPFTPQTIKTGDSGPRRTSPAMNWQTIQDRPESLYENQVEYEAEGDMCDDESRTVSPFTPPSLIQEDVIANRQWWRNEHRPSIPRAISGYISDDYRLMKEAGGGRRWFHAHREDLGNLFVPAPSFQQSSQRMISLPVLIRPQPRTIPDRGLYTSFCRPRGMRAATFLADRKSQDRAVTKPLSISEKAFFDQVDRKLNWLSFELSAGFRGPEDNPADHYKAAHGGTTGNPVSRVTEPHKRANLGLPVSGRDSLNRKRLRRRKSQVTRLDAWRVKVNDVRRLAGYDEVLKTVERRDEGQPADGDIDTAAWILRRPPQVGPLEMTRTVQPVYKRSKSKAEKQHDWEKVRRPSTIKKHRKRISRPEWKITTKNKSMIRRVSHCMLNVVKCKGTRKVRSTSSLSRSSQVTKGQRTPVEEQLSDTGFENTSLTTRRTELNPFDIDFANVDLPPEANDGRRVISKGRNPFAEISNNINAPVSLKLKFKPQLQIEKPKKLCVQRRVGDSPPLRTDTVHSGHAAAVKENQINDIWEEDAKEASLISRSEGSSHWFDARAYERESLLDDEVGECSSVGSHY